MAMKACAGPGKTALLAWLGWNFLLTRPHAMVGATSVNAANLRANPWTELARWYAAPRAGLLRALFTMTKTEVFAIEHPQTWRLEAGS
jgi:phage terminase large subunit